MAKATPAKKTTAIVPWQDDLAKYAAEAKASEKAVGGKFVSFKGGQITLNGATVPGGALRIVVLSHIMENQLFDGAYNPDQPASPICYAFGTSEDALAPHADAAHPQCASCKGCPANEWGSAAVGRGKACKNVRRLAFIVADDLDNIDGAEIYFAKLPVTSVKNWIGYVNQVATQFNRPPFAAITQLEVTPDNQVTVKFAYCDEDTDEKIGTQEVFDKLLTKRKVAEDAIVFGYPKMDESAPKPAAKVAGKSFAPKGGTAKPGAKFIPKGR